MRLSGKSGAVIWRRLNSPDVAERKEALAHLLSVWLSEAELLRLAWAGYRRATTKPTAGEHPHGD
jgi:hypothetical protein